LFGEVTQTVIMPTVIDIIVNRKNANTRLQDSYFDDDELSL